MNQRLLPFEADLLRAAPFTYAEVGATLGDLPSGYHHLTETFVIGSGRAAFEAAAAQLMTWQLQRRSGLRVVASADRVEAGAVAVLRLGPGPLSLRAPVRVVAVLDEPDRQGFVYGTLPGHPERGEELFAVAIDEAGETTLRVTAFSRPGTWLSRMTGPVGRSAQRRMTRRYGRALRS